jgi:hypothetical protein
MNNQTRAPILIGPRAQMPRRMHEMLHRMHRHRRYRVGDIEDALDPQQRITMAVEQHRQPVAEPGPINRLVEAERQSADIVGVVVMIVGRMASIAEAIRPLPDAVAGGVSAGFPDRANKFPDGPI